MWIGIAACDQFLSHFFEFAQGVPTAILHVESPTAANANPAYRRRRNHESSRFLDFAQAPLRFSNGLLDRASHRAALGVGFERGENRACIRRVRPGRTVESGKPCGMRDFRHVH